MNYRVDFQNIVECNFTTTDEECGEYYNDDGSTYEVYPSFSKAKKRYIEIVYDAMLDFKYELKRARKLKKKDIR